MPDDQLVGGVYVCRYCGAHMRIGARKRIALLFDKDSFEEIDASLQSGNPLSFPEYDGKLEKARTASNENSVITGFARVGGMSCGVFFNGSVLHDGFDGYDDRRKDNAPVRGSHHAAVCP